jgi:hypothetical protein
MGPPCKSSWSKKTHPHEGITFPGLRGMFDVLGGDWQNAVYEIVLDEAVNSAAVAGGGAEAFAATAVVPIAEARVISNATAMGKGDANPFSAAADRKESGGSGSGGAKDSKDAEGEMSLADKLSQAKTAFERGLLTESEHAELKRSIMAKFLA